jgi:hypothetical protein
MDDKHGGVSFCDRGAMNGSEGCDHAWLWFDIDLETIPHYDVWKPESVEWAQGVHWAKVNELVRSNPARYPTDDHAAAIGSAWAAGLGSADLQGLSSLYSPPIYATAPQITAGGHRITAMRIQGVRWALGWCHRNDVGDGTGGTVDRLLVLCP